MSDGSFPCDDLLLAISKFLAEAKLSESKVILSWQVNKGLLCLERILARRRDHVPEMTLERLMGRQNHTAFVIPLSRHFTGRLY